MKWCLNRFRRASNFVSLFLAVEVSSGFGCWLKWIVCILMGFGLVWVTDTLVLLGDRGERQVARNFVGKASVTNAKQEWQQYRNPNDLFW